MKTFTKFYIIAELLDYFTTFVGLLIFPQMREINPLFAILGYNWFYLLLVKTLVVLFIIFMLEKINWSKAMWVLPIATMIPVVINISSIIAETISKI